MSEFALGPIQYFEIESLFELATQLNLNLKKMGGLGHQICVTPRP